MPNPQRSAQLKELESKIGASFFSEQILDQALTHSSFVNEYRRQDTKDNERLEFLGDAVLKLIVSHYLFDKFPERAEGELTKIRAAVVSDLALSEIGRKLGLGSYLLLGRNEKLSGGDRKKSNIANALEAVIAAVYIDHGMEKARAIVINLLKESIDKASAEGFIIDYKSALQELCQKSKWGLPFYRVEKELGPKHKRIFLIEVRVKNQKFGTGRGLSKKEAEQNAAKDTLALINSKPAEKKLPERPAGESSKGIKKVLFGLLKRGKR